MNKITENMLNLYCDEYTGNKPMIDKVFTVFTTEEDAAAAGVEINCGARSCLGCGRCYTRKTGKFVYELKH